MKKLKLAICIFCIGSSTLADMPPRTSSQGWDAASYGFRRNAKVAILNASAQPTEFTVASPQVTKEMFPDALIKNIDDVIALDKTRIFLASVNRKIVIEKYTASWLKQTTPLGYSMSKSLTSLAFGKLMCKHQNVNLKTKGYELISEFKNTSWGNSEISHVLNMMSGSSNSPPPYTGWQSESVGAKHRGIYDGFNNIDLIKEMIADDVKAHEPGSSFQYNNYDTIFLGLLIEAVAKKPFHQFFDEEIWHDINSKSSGGWLVNKNGNTYAAMGFSASPEDWLRIGHYVIDSSKKDDCFGNYLKNAIQTMQKTHVSSMCYGFQIWNFCRPGLFHFWGFGGQHLVMNPNKNSVIYTHSAIQADDSGAESNLFKLLGLTTRLIPVTPAN
jgi:CubicO group peptidase (beta-lactamase class C family)